MTKVKVSTKEAAKFLSVSEQTIDNYRKKGILHGVRYTARGRWKFYLSDLLRLRDGDNT